MRGDPPTPGAVLLVECLKLHRSPALWVAVGTPVALSALLCLGLMARTELADSPYWDWGYYFQMTRAMWGVFVFPALLATLAALSLGVEHRQDNWKSQLVQPVPVGFLYWAKFLVLVALVACSQIVLYGSTLLLGRALQLTGWPPAIELVTALVVIPASLPVLALQFGFSLNWRSFVLPVGIGLFAHFISLVAASVPIAGFRPGYYSPWSFLLRALRVSGAGVVAPVLELAIACAMGLAILWIVQLHFMEKGRGRTPRPRAWRRAALLRYAVAGLAVTATLAGLVGVHLGQRARIDSLRDQVVRIATSQPDGDHRDLEAFGRAVGDARVVLLGEASHGDGATLRLKSRLVRYLHEEKGFDVLAVESGLYDCLRAGEEILEGADSVEWSSKAVFDVWSESAQVRPLFHYLGKTVDGGRPLQLAGFDMQLSGDVSTDLLVDDLREFLSEAYPSLIETEDWQVASGELRELVSDAKAWRTQDKTRFDRALTAIAGLETALRARPPKSAQQFRRAEFWAQNLSSLHKLLRFVRTLDPEDTSSVRDAAPIRERAMAENLLWLVERHFADRKIIVWGATSHVSRNREAIDSGRYASMIPMGQEIWDALGDRSYVVGFSSFEGLRGLPKKGDDGHPRDIGVAPENSLEDLLARAGYEVGFIDLRRLDPTSVLASPIKARPLGHAPMEAEWSRVLDGLFFIRRMTPSTIAEKTR